MRAGRRGAVPAGLRFALICLGAALCRPATAEPLTAAEGADLERYVASSLLPTYEVALGKTGSTLIQGSPEWNDAFHRTVSALLAARPAGCLPAVWALGGCGRHLFEDPSRSMLPTMLDRDVVVTVPPDASTPIRRGDVVAYQVPGRGPEQHLHRVIGLPGDRIRLVRGVVELNGRALEREPTGLVDLVSGLGQVAAYTESLPDGRSYRVFWPDMDPKDARGADMAPTVVPEGHYFVLGDDRSAAVDSRPPDGIGMPAAADVVGIARAVILSRDAERIGAPL